MGREVGSGKWEVGERECVWGGEKKGEKSSLEGSEVKEEMGIVGSERQISRVKKKKKNQIKNKNTFGLGRGTKTPDYCKLPRAS